MNDDAVFRTPSEELQKLLGELARISADLREISMRVSQIDRHVRRAFKVPKMAPNADRAMRRPGSRPAPTLSRDAALALFEELTHLARGQGLGAAEGRLETLGLPDLKLLAHELGISFQSKPSRKTLRSRVIGRVNESIMLSRNVNVREPRDAGAIPAATDLGRDEEPKQ
jgi:hypothetical protein